MQKRIVKVAAVLLVPTLLSGCIAAAIPVLAGSVLAGKDRVGLGSASKENDNPEPQVTLASPENSPTNVEIAAVSNEELDAEPRPEPEPEAGPKTGSFASAFAETPTPEETATLAENAPVQGPPVLVGVDAFTFNLAKVRTRVPIVAVPADPDLVDTDEAEAAFLPEAKQPETAPALARKAPDQPAQLSAAKPASAKGLVTNYSTLPEISSYVDNQAKRDPIMEPRASAILAAPGSLTPDRADCSIRPPAVVFDLDPAGATFDPAVAAKADLALIQMLHAFRMQEIEIFWISELAAVDAGKVRTRLIESGLDPMGRDGLLLMRRADDRKQARRSDLSQTHCVVAIAGDSKSDFDELYDYLKDPSAAKPLDDLLGGGWFLTPLPLLD